MPAGKDVGEPGAGEPHARFDEAAGGIRRQWPKRPTVLAPPADPTLTYWQYSPVFAHLNSAASLQSSCVRRPDRVLCRLLRVAAASSRRRAVTLVDPSGSFGR
jgi:hypothetical protein